MDVKLLTFVCVLGTCAGWFVGLAPSPNVFYKLLAFL